MNEIKRMTNPPDDLKEKSTEAYRQNITFKIEPSPVTYNINFFHEVEDDRSLLTPYLDILANAKEGDSINFNVCSMGGSVTSWLLLYDHLKQTKARTKAVIYTANSAGALLALSCDEVAVSPTADFMLHNALLCGNMSGKLENVRDSHNHLGELMKTHLHKVCSRIMTTEEIDQMILGKDFYFTSEDLVNRLIKFGKQHKEEGKTKTKKKAPKPGIPPAPAEAK